MTIYKEYLKKLKVGLDQIDLVVLEKVSNVLWDALHKERLIYIIGNGGSASTASHMACDLAKNTLKDLNGEEKRFRVLCPSDNVATLTAYANDAGYETIFEQPLRNLLSSKDIVIAISASGNSPNIVHAVQYAKKKGAITIGLVGFTGGKLKKICDYILHFPEEHYGRSEDAHLVINHMIREALFERKNLKFNP